MMKKFSDCRLYFSFTLQIDIREVKTNNG